MKGDFSRFRFGAAKNYTAVLEQQGRVQLDSDANEQRGIDWHRLTTEAIDVIGATGGPRHDAGFAIALRPDNASLTIGAGRYYLDGLLCEAAQSVDYTQQPWLIGATPGIAVMLADLRAGRTSAVQIWLEAWQRLVTPIDDPCIRDPALGEADTTVRLQTVWRAVAEAVPATSTGDVSTLLQAVTGLSQAVSMVSAAAPSSARQTVGTAADTLASQLRAGTITGARLKSSLASLHANATTVLPAVASAQPDSGTQISASLTAIGNFDTGVGAVDCCAAMRLKPILPQRGTMTASTDDTTDLGPCLPSPQAAYRGLENQLYRIEVHQGGPLNQATFKWSRDNGSVLTRIIHVNGAVLTVDSLGPDVNLGFAPLQWVEISDDSDEFGQTPDQPGQLRQIKIVDFQHNRVTLTSPAPAVDTTNGHAKLRRWDHSDPGATEAGLAMAPGGATGTWHSLENGIRVQFASSNTFQPGDYWLVPARTATGELEWPPCDSDGAEFQPAHNTRIHRAPLACIGWAPNAGGFVPRDCRDFFYPLTELAPPPAQSALHVTDFNWVNDDLMTLDQVQASGLSVTFDQPPAASIDAASFVVVVEAPIIAASSLQDRAFTNVTAARNIWFLLRAGVIIDGNVAPPNGNTIVWTMPVRLTSQLAQLAQALEAYVDQQAFARVRVTLKGHVIPSAGTGTPIYLDGQCFGVAATRADGKTARTALALPSGAAAKASDFESWFYLVPSERVTSVTVAPTAVAWVQVGALGNAPLLRLVDPTGTTGAAVTPTLTFTLAFGVLADTTINLSVSGGTAGIVNLPATVRVPRGRTSPTAAVTITVGNTGVATTEVYTIAVSVPLAGGRMATSTATLSVTGHPGGSTQFPPIFTGPNILRDMIRSQNTPEAPGG
jgi:Family of unknown function (DUF6519)